MQPYTSCGFRTAPFSEGFSLLVCQRVDYAKVCLLVFVFPHEKARLLLLQPRLILNEIVRSDLNFAMSDFKFCDERFEFCEEL